MSANFESIRRTPDSTTVVSFEYAPKERVLRAKFKSLVGHYDYFDVAPEQAQGGFVAESAGKWMNDFKKLGHRFEKKEYAVAE